MWGGGGGVSKSSFTPTKSGGGKCFTLQSFEVGPGFVWQLRFCHAEV